MLSIEVVPVAAMVYEPLALVPVQSADKAPSAMSLSDMISPRIQDVVTVVTTFRLF